MSLYTIYGGLGSPYSMKMRAVMRYRRLPHVWRQMQMGDERVFRHVRAPVVPVVQFLDGSWHNDSTPMIFALERLHAERSVLPKDPAEAFLCHLIEDFADEWGTKAMFHYRWFRERDALQMSQWLAFDRLRAPGRAAVMGAAATFRERQAGRMAMVGCTPENAPVIEGSTHRILSVFERFVTEQPYLFGSRPSLADFGWFGQMSQLAVDPTPQEMMRAEFPFAFRWTQELDDASGVEGEWSGAGAAAMELLKLAGEIYLPFLLANARAAAQGRETFTVELPGGPYAQGTFKYQAKCLAELRAAHAKLGGGADAVLEEAGCLEALRGT